MTDYTVHLKDGRPPVLVKEGWSWGAFLFGPLWLLAQRAWIPASLHIALLVVLTVSVRSPAQQVVGFALAILAGLLGRDLVRWSLGRRDYALAEIVAAPGRDAALARLLAHRPDVAARLAESLR